MTPTDGCRHCTQEEMESQNGYLAGGQEAARPGAGAVQFNCSEQAVITQPFVSGAFFREDARKLLLGLGSLSLNGIRLPTAPE